MTARLSFTRILRHPPEKVWRALTTGAILADWLYPNDFRAVEGAAFTFHGPVQPHWNGKITGTVLTVEEHVRLSLRWRSDGVGNAPPLDTVVTFSLEPNGQGTRLTLEQDGFLPDQIRNRAGAQAGWPMLLDRLDHLLERVHGGQTCNPE
jgi:uncharacterized protein YndB with AHSA1/START domain